MPIPQAQLDTWAKQGAVQTSSTAYASIKHALQVSSSPLANRSVEVFLQGSYANFTNIYGDSDIDVVVLYATSFTRDVSALTPLEQQAEDAAFPPATYQWSQLRDETIVALRAHFGSGAVSIGKKSIKVQTPYGRPSDVVPAIEFRRYATFVNAGKYTAHFGIQFFDSAGGRIVNYPKQHIERGEAKNQALRTGGRYKATIRVFKNLRNYAVDHGLLAKGIAPSYFIECALHDVPDNVFIGSLSDTVPAVLVHLADAKPAGLWCQNGVVPLVGGGSTQWTEASYYAFVVAALKTWYNW